MQSRTMSAIESVANIAIGLIVALATQVIVFPWFGIHISGAQDLGIAGIFTVVSLVRSFFLRRLFNKIRQDFPTEWFARIYTKVAA